MRQRATKATTATSILQPVPCIVRSAVRRAVSGRLFDDNLLIPVPARESAAGTPEIAAPIASAQAVDMPAPRAATSAWPPAVTAMFIVSSAK